MNNPLNVGAQIKTVVGVKPVTAAAAVTGAAIDRDGYGSLVLFTATGAATGSPSAQTVDSKITHCDTSGGSYEDLTGAAITQITADNGTGRAHVNLAGAKRYLKVVQTTALTGGSSPTWPASSVVVLGGAAVEPTTY